MKPDIQLHYHCEECGVTAPKLSPYNNALLCHRCIKRERGDYVYPLITNKLIGLIGYAGSGKSTVASILENQYSVVRTRFASTLKRMLKSMLISSGVSEEESIAMIDGHLKEVPCSVLGGKTPRYALQTLGTEWGRNIIDNDIWVNSTMSRVNNLINTGARVVLDDVRFPNEASAVKQHGGILIKVYRSASIPTAITHSSEDLNMEADVLLVNNGSIEELTNQIICLFGYTI